MIKKTTLLFLLFIAALLIEAQEPSEKIVVAKIVGNDTILLYDLPEYLVSARLPHKLRAVMRRHDKLVYNVKKVYPYAKLAGIKLDEYEDVLKNAKNDAERRKLMKKAESELKDQFEDDIKNLTFSQGIILIKLIDRETGDSSYVLIQELRGKFMAFFWQNLSRLFGYNLKTEYEPNGDDKDIEQIVIMIENGQL